MTGPHQARQAGWVRRIFPLARARRPGAVRSWPLALALGATLVLALVAGALAAGRLHLMRPALSAGPSAASTASASAAGPTPMATAASLMALTAVQNLAQTVRRDVADGMIRPDVGVDFGNFIRPVEADLLAGEPASVRQLAVTLRAKLAQRVSGMRSRRPPPGLSRPTWTCCSQHRERSFGVPAGGCPDVMSRRGRRLRPTHRGQGLATTRSTRCSS